MTDYTGLKCPVCGKSFTANDDIVVCPKCGAPYHRECYAEVGKCVFTEKHGTPDAWAPPKPEPTQQNSEARTKRCTNCGTPNSENAMFCEHCGQSFTANQQNLPQNGNFPQNNGFPPEGGFPQNGAPFNPNQAGGFPQGGFLNQQVPFIFDPMGGVNPNEPIENVPAGDIAKLVQSNTQYYLPVFMNLNKFKTNRFNFSAFLFSGGWMLYRKQYKLGSIIASIMVALLLASAYVSLYFAAPLEQSLFQQVGITSDTVSFTYAQLMQVSELLAQQPVSQILLFCIPPMIAIIQFIVMLIVGFNGNKWYMKHCVEKVSQIHESTTHPTEATILLQEQGGVNAALAICLLICYMIIVYIIPSI
jgi:hypothetical protein